MVQILALTVFALLLGRVARAPKGFWRYVLAAAGLAAAGSQLLPQGNALREEVAGSARTLFWLALGLVPVAAYAAWVRGLRRRSGVDAIAKPAPPRGLVQFPQDAALAAETGAALAAEAEAALSGAPVSLGWRADDGALAGHLRLRLHGRVAEVEMLRVDPRRRRQGLGATLLRAAEDEAVARGALRIGALVGDWQAPGFFARAGYAEAPPGPDGPPRRRWMEKAL